MDSSSQTAAGPAAPADKEMPQSLPAVKPPTQPKPAWDWALAGLLVTLAFLLASQPARNSDAWLHLATGRAFLEGSYRLGSDPFAWTTEGMYWANPSWLYDVGSYELYRILGGTSLVVLKALLIALLAAVLLRACWHAGHRWLAAQAIGLAFIALSPYLALRPTVVSYLFLGLTLAWLMRAPDLTVEPSACRPYLTLLVLFALWANLDEWFLLGPATVLLYALGTWINSYTVSTPVAGSASKRAAALALVGLAGVGVCVVNPHHVRIFAPPTALVTGPAAEVAEEALGYDQTLSPFQTAYFEAGLALTPGALAYYLLVLLGLLSFAARAPNVRWPLVLLWAGFFAFSIWRGPAVPFFAVVAGVVLALHARDYAAETAGTVGQFLRRQARRLQAAAVLLLAVGTVASWPGWLQGLPAEPRAWTLDVDPSVEGAARHLAEWHADGRLPGASRGLNFSPAVAHYLAWFCPDEKSFIDSRCQLFTTELAEDYLEVRRGLQAETGPTGKAGSDWRGVLRKHGVTHLVLYDRREQNLRPALSTVLASPREWSLAYLEGRTAVLGWQRGTGPDPKLPRLDLDAWAYRPPEDKRAPPAGPGRDPRPRTWLDGFYRPRPGANRDKDEAFSCLIAFEAGRPAYGQQALREWQAGRAAGLVGVCVPGAAGFGNLAGCSLHEALLLPVDRPADPTARGKEPSAGDLLALQLLSRFLDGRDAGPPGTLLLAIRAARRALRAEPDDAVNHHLLGLAYMRLRRATRERASIGFALLEQVRAVQTITALKQAVLLKPDLVQAHNLLAGLYQQLKYDDLALLHLQELLRHTRAAGPQPTESTEQFAERLGRLDEEVRIRDKAVSDLWHRLETESYGEQVVVRAQKAERTGLPGKALDILLASDASTLGAEGARLELHLLLLTGRLAEAGAGLGFAPENARGPDPFRALRMQLALAEGNYAQADHYLELLAAEGARPAEMRASLAVLPGRFILESAPLAFVMPLTDTVELRQEIATVRQMLRHHADVVALRGLLALEAGQAGQAARLFQASLNLDRDPPPASAAALVRAYLDRLTPGEGR